MHNVKAALGVVRILLKLHQAFLHSKRNDELSLGWNHQLPNRNYVITDTFWSGATNVAMVNLVFWAPYKFRWIRFIFEKANTDAKFVHVGFQTTDEVVLSYHFDSLWIVAVFENVEECRIFAKLVIGEIPLSCKPWLLGLDKITLEDLAIPDFFKWYRSLFLVFCWATIV